MRLLFIQHARALGGSAISLLYTMRGLRERGHECIVGLAQPSLEIAALYERNGFRVERMERIAIFKHCNGSHYPWYWWRTWYMFFGLIRRWNGSMKNTMALTRKVNPDLVHLNGMPLSSCALALRAANFPFVWHIRESPPDQGLRTHWLRKQMVRAPKLIFISEFDREKWVNNRIGNVVPNFVDRKQFFPRPGPSVLREQLELSESAKVVLYVGGFSEIKGIFPLLDALAILKKSRKDIVCLMPGALPQEVSQRRCIRLAKLLVGLFGHKGFIARVERRIHQLKLIDCVRTIRFVDDIAPYIALSDVVVFPAILPHFARPIMEATAMEKPVVGSDLGGIRELVALNPLGHLTRPGDAFELARKIDRALKRSDKCIGGAKMRFDAFRTQFCAENSCRKIEEIYNMLLNEYATELHTRQGGSVREPEEIGKESSNE